MRAIIEDIEDINLLWPVSARYNKAVMVYNAIKALEVEERERVQNRIDTSPFGFKSELLSFFKFFKGWEEVVDSSGDILYNVIEDMTTELSLEHNIVDDEDVPMLKDQLKKSKKVSSFIKELIFFDFWFKSEGFFKKEIETFNSLSPKERERILGEVDEELYLLQHALEADEEDVGLEEIRRKK